MDLEKQPTSAPMPLLKAEATLSAPYLHPKRRKTTQASATSQPPEHALGLVEDPTRSPTHGRQATDSSHHGLEYEQPKAETKPVSPLARMREADLMFTPQKGRHSEATTSIPTPAPLGSSQTFHAFAMSQPRPRLSSQDGGQQDLHRTQTLSPLR